MKKLISVLFLITIVLVGCKGAMLPPAPSSVVPLVEYSPDGGENWYGLGKDEIKRVHAQTVQIRQTEQGAGLELKVEADTASPSFDGSLESKEGVIEVKGTGSVVIFMNNKGYARIILE